MVSRKRLIDGHRANKIGRNGIKVHLPNLRVGTRLNHTINRGIAQPRFSATNLYILTFALIALKRHARQTTKSVSHILVGEALDLSIREHIEDILRRALLVDGGEIAVLAGGNLHLLTIIANPQGCVEDRR